jgi:hypothetical protein
MISAAYGSEYGNGQWRKVKKPKKENKAPPEEDPLP